MTTRAGRLLGGFLLSASVCAALVTPPHLTAQADASAQWVIPRTSAGHPDLQGDWTNATLTQIQRPPGLSAVLSPEAIAAMEGGMADFLSERYEDSDPDRGAPPVGGVRTGNALWDAAGGGTGAYNYFWIDPGERVAVFNGEPRGSLVTFPEDGRIPELTAAGRQQRAAVFARTREFGQYDNPENRPLAERCLMSFGSNAGPPMLPNYFYNNNYTIVQTPDHVMILTEMVHDVRIIRLGDRRPLPDDVRPWMGDSWGHWAGDTLVVETTNLPAKQLFGYALTFPGGSPDFKVIERFTRADEVTMNYEFTIIDPVTYTSEWGGEVPFKRLSGDVYEYACHEANYAMENVLRGARAQERESGEAR